MDKEGPLSEQVPYRSFFSRVNVSLSQNAKGKHLGKPERVALVVRMLQSVVLMICRRVCKANLITGIHQSINEPVPVESAFNSNGLDIHPEWFEFIDNPWQFIRKPLVENLLLIILIQYPNVSIVRMQIHPDIQFHNPFLLSLSFSSSFSTSSLKEKHYFFLGNAF